MVQLAGQSAPYSSTPISRSLGPDGEDDLDLTQSAQSANQANLSRFSQQDGVGGGVSPVLEADPTFVTARGSSFFVGDGEGGLSCAADCQSGEDLAGSYCYASRGATPPGAPPAGRSTPSGEFGWNSALK